MDEKIDGKGKCYEEEVEDPKGGRRRRLYKQSKLIIDKKDNFN